MKAGDGYRETTYPAASAPRLVAEHAAAWARFRAAGLVWFVNRILHVFGWALVFHVHLETGEVLAVVPERVQWRGFTGFDEQVGFEQVARFLRENAPVLYAEADYAQPGDPKPQQGG